MRQVAKLESRGFFFEHGFGDRAALGAMDVSPQPATVSQPGNSTEQWIVNLWRSLLGGIAVGVEDDFFALGGYSLLAIKMLQRVRKIARYAALETDLPLPT